MKVLVVIDMQNDFLTGSLANAEGVKAIPNVLREIKALKDEDVLLFTRDTHTSEYLKTQEGRRLPVEHCIKGTKGHLICDELISYANDNNTVDKLSFGSRIDLVEAIEKAVKDKNASIEAVEAVTFVGVCTDICVISNAMICKAAFPETTIQVVADACAGISVESHNNALEAMKMCQIDII